ncbi:MAG: hypothetical protein ACR2QT_05450 [Woeseiaceae bacterium]
MRPQNYHSGRACLAIGATISLFIAVAAHSQGVPPPPSSTKPAPVAETPVTSKLNTHMSEALRASIEKVVVVPGDSPAERAVAGDYQKPTDGLYGGLATGAGMGTVSTDIGPVIVNFPIPILQLPGMIFGGLKGSTQREIQEFRDALVKDLVKAPSKPLSNEKIALDVYSDIRKLPDIDSNLFAPTTPIPEDADVVVYVSIKEIGINVEKNVAIITTTAKATVTRVSDETDIYGREVQYQDRDTLSNWTDNDNVVWRDYTNFARHYIGREFSSEVFHTVAVKHTLVPTKSGDVSVVKKNPWQGTSKKLSPTLAWDLALPGHELDPAWVAGLGKSEILFDVEIYDLQRPVYSATGISASQHKVTAPLDACKSYKWSVRPSYQVEGETKYGIWMRADTADGNGNIGRKASAAPAFLQDFASLDIKCGAK